MTVAIAIGPVVITKVFGDSATSSKGLSVQVKVDLNKAVIALTALGFHHPRSADSHILGPSYHADCAKTATHEVKRFLTHYPCKEYATASRTITKRGTTTLVAFSWIEMPSTVLANQYKAIVDEPDTGNPPGMSLAFNGLCYASGERSTVVWAVQVEPTGYVNTDRQILQAAVQGTLTPSYLRRHCVK